MVHRPKLDGNSNIFFSAPIYSAKAYSSTRCAHNGESKLKHHNKLQWPSIKLA